MVNEMRESKALYGFTDNEDFQGIVWETDKGLMVTCTGKLDIKNNISIRSVESGEDVGDVDLRNLLLSVLPTK